MPPKDDDNSSTKEVVTKKQKQMLNREELDLSLIAEAFGGVIMEADVTTGRGGIPQKKYQGKYRPRSKVTVGRGGSGSERVTVGQGGQLPKERPPGVAAAAQAQQDAAIDITQSRAQETKKGYEALARSIGYEPMTGRPSKPSPTRQSKPFGSPPAKVRGAAADPFLQFPKKPQKQYGLPKPPSSRVPYGNRTLSGTPLRSALPAARQTSTMTPDQVRQLLIPGYDSGSTKSSNLTKSLRTISSFPLLGGRTKAVITTATTAIDLAKAYRKIRDKKVEDRMQELELSRGLRPGRQPSETPTIKPFKPKKPFQLPSFPIPKPGPKTEPQTQPEADPGKKSKPKGIDMSSILRFFKIPGQGVDVKQKQQPKPQPQSQRPPVKTRSGTMTGTKKQDKKKDRKPFSFPDQPGGVIGRRQNPQ